MYKSVFWGKELVSWLVEVGLAHDRAEAVKYGKALLNGCIIKQFDEKYHFHDSLYFYVFNASATINGFDNNAMQTVNSSMSEEDLSSS